MNVSYENDITLRTVELNVIIREIVPSISASHKAT